MHDVIDCLACRKPLRAPETTRGKLVRCPHCGHVFRNQEEVPLLELVDEPADTRPPSAGRATDITPTLPPAGRPSPRRPAPLPARRRTGRDVRPISRPWFLFVLAGLPLGLPLLGLLAHQVARVDLGLALGIGLGAALALLALSGLVLVARLSVGGRAALVGGLNGFAYLLGAILVILAGRDRHADSRDEGARRPPPRRVSVNPDKALWKEFELPGGNCMVQLPGVPVETPMPGPPGADVLSSRKYMLTLQGSDLIFAVVYLDIADWGMRLASLEQRCAAEANLICQATRGRVVWRGPATLAGRPAQEFRVEVPGKRGTFIERLCDVPQGGRHRLYLLAIAGTPISPGCPDAEQFFNSFRFRGTAPPNRPPAKQGPARLVGHWTFDEGAGERCQDVSGRGNHGTVHAAEWVEGIRGKALRLRGPGSYFDYGKSADFNFAAGAPFTFAGWVRTKDREGTLVSQRSGAPGRGAPVIDILLIGGQIAVDLRDDGNEFGAHVALRRGPPIDDGRWHHFALTRGAGGVATLYVDGRHVDQGVTQQSVGAITTDLRGLGREGLWAQMGRGQNAHLVGDVDDFRIYQGALTEAEVKGLATPPPPARP